MTIGVGGSTFEAELALMSPMLSGIEPISVAELQARLAKAQRLLREQGMQALYLDTSTSLNYFTGIPLRLTERLHGAVIPVEGEIAYLSPAFEEPKTRELIRFGDDVRVWEEHEDPIALIREWLKKPDRILIEPRTDYAVAAALARAMPDASLLDGSRCHR